MTNAEKILNHWAARFLGVPGLSKSVDASVQVHIKDAPGEQYWFFHCKTHFELSNDRVETADCTITAKLKDFEEVFGGNTNPQRAVLERKIQLSGDATALRRFSVSLSE